MTFSKGLREVLRNIEGLKIYPIIAPEGVKTPFLVYRRSRSKYIKDLSGITNNCEDVYELLLIADSYFEIENYCTEIKNTLLNCLFTKLGEEGPFIENIELEFTGEEYIYQPNAIKSCILLTANYKEE